MNTVPDETRIPGIAPRSPVSVGARHALKQRLGSVDSLVPLATPKHVDDTEYVVDLRLATRRALVALQTFAQTLSDRRVRDLETELRRLRRDTGAACDLNVLVERLSSEDTSIAFQAVSDRVLLARRNALRRLGEAHQHWVQHRIGQQITQAVQHARWRESSPEPAYATVGRLTTYRCANDFFTATSFGSREVALLYDIRTYTKEARHLLELFAGVFEATTRDQLHTVIELVQQKIEAVLDHATAKNLFTKWLVNCTDQAEREQLDQLLAAEDDRLQESFAYFRDWWAPSRVRETRKLFDQLLGHQSATSTIGS